MIEATVDDKEENNSRKLTNEMITIHSITFMLAGYESTASTLSYTCYLLALHPHIQEKLQTEIDNFYSENPVMLISMCAPHMIWLPFTGNLTVPGSSRLGLLRHGATGIDESVSCSTSVSLYCRLQLHPARYGLANNYM